MANVKPRAIDLRILGEDLSQERVFDLSLLVKTRVQFYVYAIGNYLPGFKIVYGVYELNQLSTVSKLAKDTK